MAQENSPDKEKRQGRTKKPEKPYVEQIDELLLVHNKNDPKSIAYIGLLRYSFKFIFNSHM